MNETKLNSGGAVAKGTADWSSNRTGGGKYVARFQVAGKRVRVDMLGEDGQPLFTNKAKDKQRARRHAHEMYKQLADAKALNDVVEPKQRTPITVEAFGIHWTSGALFREYGEVKKLKIKKSARDDRNRLTKYVYPYLGNMPIASVNDEQIERAFAKAARAFQERNGRPMSQATKRHMYMVTHRLFELAVRPGRLRTTNPVGDDLLPAKGPSKNYGFLYPQELVDTLGCTDIHIARRVYYAMGTYTGLRKASLNALRWGSIDFEHKTIVSLVSKNDEPQMFAQSDPHLLGLSSLIELLRRYREYLGWPDDHELILPKLHCKKDGEAAKLRDDLDCAGITRRDLFLKSEKNEPLRFHDLRATFVTWARRAQKGDGWISDRTGHLTQAVMHRYNRAARTLNDLKIDPFPDVSLAIPELRDLNVTRLAKRNR